MDAVVAAGVFLNWAFDEGLTNLESRPQAVAVPNPHPLAGVSSEAKEMLRDRVVQGVAGNSNAAEIVVYLRKVAPRSKKLLEKLPHSIDDIAIKYSQGVTQAVDPDAPMPFGGPPYAIHQTLAGKCYTCGSSISVGNYREAGTLGALLRDTSDRLFGLSNSHVVASCNHAPLRTPILAPGVCDVTATNLPPFTIGFLAACLPLVSGSPDTISWQDNTDAAVFELMSPDAVSSMQQSFYDTPSSTMPIAAGMSVSKVGRTTGRTSGTVVGVMAGYFGVPYSAGVYNFKGTVYQQQVYVVNGASTAFSESGDSGSLVVHTDSHGVQHAVGILFAGMQNANAAGGSSSLVLPLEPVLTRLGMTLVSGHNV